MGSADLTALQQHPHQGRRATSRPRPRRAAIIHYGIREHGMAAAMNGITLHGGFRTERRHLPGLRRLCPPGDAAGRADGPAGVVYVMTHDSIGLGEDGPTHQPVEQLAALRAMPNMRVFRPATRSRRRSAGSWRSSRTDGPTVLALLAPEPAAAAHRRAPTTTAAPPAATNCSPAEGGKAQVSLFASGSEVEIAVAARKLLAERGVRVARRLGAVARTAAGAGRGDAGRDHRRCAGQDRRRGRRALRLGCRDRPGRRLRRHGRFRRQRAPTRRSTSISALPPRRSSTPR